LFDLKLQVSKKLTEKEAVYAEMPASGLGNYMWNSNEQGISVTEGCMCRD
jgi:hypothetical protein